MLVNMKKALKDLTTAHFTKNMLRVRNTQTLIFFSIKHVFAFKHISIENQEIMQDILFDFPFWYFEVLFVSIFGIKAYAKLSVPFNTASIVEETGPKVVFFGLGPTLKTTRSTLKLILTYTLLSKSVQKSIPASVNFGS